MSGYYNTKRKKLVEQLKPSTNGGGKVIPCPRCGGPAEHVSTTIATCPRCDKPRSQADVRKVSIPADPDVHYLYLGEDPDDEWSEPTQPGHPAFQRWYGCSHCPTETLADVDAVAAGQGCVCGGKLFVK